MLTSFLVLEDLNPFVQLRLAKFHNSIVETIQQSLSKRLVTLKSTCEHRSKMAAEMCQHATLCQEHLQYQLELMPKSHCFPFANRKHPNWIRNWIWHRKEITASWHRLRAIQLPLKISCSNCQNYHPKRGSRRYPKTHIFYTGLYGVYMGFIWVLYGFGKPWVSNQTLGFQINTLGFAINIRGLYGFYTGKKPNPTFFSKKLKNVVWIQL